MVAKCNSDFLFFLVCQICSFADLNMTANIQIHFLGSAQEPNPSRDPRVVQKVAMCV